MEEKKQYYTISVYTENNVGLVNRISTIFLKRHVNLLSMTASESEIEDVYRFTILVKMTQEKVQKIVGQIEKQIEVIRAYYHTDEQTISQETALYKVKSELLFDEPQIQNIIKRSGASIVTVNKRFFVISKTGRRIETEALHSALKPYGVLQFTRSGRIAVTKEAMNISEVLKDFDDIE